MKRRAMTKAGAGKRGRAEPGWTVTIDRHCRIPLPGLPYKVGTRLFWKVNGSLNAVVGTETPKGTLRRGRYHSSRIRVMALPYRTLKSIANAR